jgi:hypothetical protein
LFFARTGPATFYIDKVFVCAVVPPVDNHCKGLLVGRSGDREVSMDFVDERKPIVGRPFSLKRVAGMITG